MLRCLPLAAALAVGVLLSVSLRLLMFFLAVHGIRASGALVAALLAPWPFFDPVYTQAALYSLTGVHIAGLALAGPFGDWLHAHFPGLAVDGARSHWALARLAVTPGSPVLGRLLAAAIAHATVLGVGLLLVRAGHTRHRRTLVLAGVAVQVQVALSILGSQPSVRELEATGVSFAANALLPSMVARSDVLSGGVDQLWPPLAAAALVGLALAIAYTPGALVLLRRKGGRRFMLNSAAGVVLTASACAGIISQDVGYAAAPAAAAAQQASIAPVAAHPPASAAQQASSQSVVAAHPAAVTLDDWFAQSSMTSPTAPPSHVSIVGSGFQFQYLVNGQPTFIKGMGLNTQYSHQLSPEARAAQLDSDMAELSALGVNTVLGWDPSEFDGVLLDAAQRHGIGVVMPFDLDPDADYTDPQVRQQLQDQALAWVAQYRDYPALRMWGLGNEVLHKIVHPAWVGPQDAHQELEAEAFSDWLIQTADKIHALDPNHPVTYRSAEDAFVSWIVAAMHRGGDVQRPWLVFGTNCYQSYLSDIVDRWPDAGMSSPLWVSEFAPGAMGVPDRPDGFATMWGYVTRHPDYVLGGAVYAWTRNGPEGVDQNFGLTDDGAPVDGRSLDMLSSLFHAT